MVIYTDHTATRYFMLKNNAKPQLIRWLLFLQEFNVEIRDKKGTKNVVTDHLSRLKLKKKINDPNDIDESFPNDQLFGVDTYAPWYTDIINFLACKVLLPDLTSQQRKKFLHDMKCYQWDDPLIFQRCVDQMIKRCVSEEEYDVILAHCYFSSYGGHMGPLTTSWKVLDFGFCCPTIFQDCFEYIKRCNQCQRLGNILRRDEMPLNSMLEVEVFNA